MTGAREPKQEISSSERPVTRAHRASKRSFRVAKQSRRARRAAETAAAEPPAPPPVYDGRNEYHSPLGKLLGSAK